MKIDELKLYTKNSDAYTATDVEELEPMTDDELDEFQCEIDYTTGNTSEWDKARAVITFRKHIHDLEGLYNKSQADVVCKKKEIEKLELINKEFALFKDMATSYLTKEQLLEIENKMKSKGVL